MSRLEGGIFSRPRGKTGGVVFGAARTREGKLVTSRLLVVPSNPQTAAQVAQRGKFTAALQLTRGAGTGYYQVDFNRAVAQLPGFQSMMSILMNAMDEDAEFAAAPADTNLGTLAEVASAGAAAGSSSGEVDVSWTPSSANTAQLDDVQIVGFSGAAVAAGAVRFVAKANVAIGSSPETLEGFGAGEDVLVAVWGRGSIGSAYEGKFTPVQWFLVSAGS